MMPKLFIFNFLCVYIKKDRLTISYVLVKGLIVYFNSFILNFLFMTITMKKLHRKKFSKLAAATKQKFRNTKKDMILKIFPFLNKISN